MKWRTSSGRVLPATSAGDIQPARKKEMTRPMTAMTTVSMVSIHRRAWVGAPTTFWVLMLRMRTGAKEVKKLAKLITPDISTRMPMASSRKVVPRLPLRKVRPSPLCPMK